MIGRRTALGTPTELAADEKRVARLTLNSESRLAKLTFLLDGLGAGSGTAFLKPVIYSAGSNALLAVGDEIAVPHGTPAKWVDVYFSSVPGGVHLLAGDYDIGLIAGGGTNVARVYAATAAAGGRKNADTYANGPADPFGATTALTVDMAVFAFQAPVYAPPTNELEFYYARLPFNSAQTKLSETGPLANTGVPVSCAWHGTFLDPERGSFAVVANNGPLESLIGERIKITSGHGQAGERSVYAFVHNLAELEDPISITRRLFMALCVPGFDRINALVEKMS